MSKANRGGARLSKNEPVRRQAGSQRPARPPRSSDPQKKSKRRDSGAALALKIMLIILVVVLTLLIIFIFWHKRNISLPGQRNQGGDQLQTPDPITGITPPDRVMANTPRKEGFYTFLLVGLDTGGGGNTDTMMLAAYDIPNQRLSVMSLPRDTMVDARHPDHNRKLNGVWNLGLAYYGKKNPDKKGIDYLMESVGDMLGFVPDFHIVVKWDAFGRLVDTLGGVEFNVPYNMDYDDPTQNLHIHVKKGNRVLTGEEAKGVVRWRSGYASGDLGRIQTQQALMKEIVKKCLRIENVTKINEFAKIFSEEVDTDLTLGNLAAFAEKAIFGGLNMDNVRFATMPNIPVYVGKDSYVQAKADELLGFLNDGFNPYTEDLTMEALHILQYKSSTGYYTYSGTGTGTPPIYTDPKPVPVIVPPSDTPDDIDANGEDPDTDHTDAPDASDAPDSTLRPSEGGAPAGIGDPDDGPTERPGDRPSESTQPSESPGASERPSASPPSSASPSPSASSKPSSSEAPASSAPPGSGSGSNDRPVGIPVD